MSVREEILKLLEENAEYTSKNISDALGITEEEVNGIVNECKENGILLGSTAVVNWDKTEKEYCSAIIEINVVTKTGDGFEEVARKLASFPEVTALYLMSGGYDLAVMIEGKSMKEVAMFVYQKLAVVEGVTGTATHFILNKYKEKNVLFKETEKDEREWL